jgi:leucyl aminopeptidase
MPVSALKIETRTSLHGAADLVSFALKGEPARPGVPLEEFDGAPLGHVLLREPGRRTLLVGLGDKEKLQADTLRRAAGLGVKHLLKLGSKDIALDLTAFADHAAAAVEGALLASYKFDGFGKDPSKNTRGVLSRLQVIVPENEVTQARASAQRAEQIVGATNTIRALGNLPGNMLNPAVLAEKVTELAEGTALAVKIWDEKQLKREGFGGILAVGRGSINPPRLIQIDYRGGGKKETPLALVGKAVTFDTGGISIKPGAAMDEMKWDKMGGMAVIGIMLAVAKLKLPINLIALVPAAENMPGPDAYRPGDILTTYDGKTIEVLNTDAEGRIILVDAIAYVRRNFKPSAIVEFSTLTGSCVMALGHQRAGLFTTEEKWRDALVAAGAATGDLVWPMPIDEEYREAVLSEVATAKNTSFREGSACASASFVKLWAEDTPFVHLDIAGTAWTTKPPPYLEGGATGFGVRLIVHLLRAGVPA